MVWLEVESNYGRLLGPLIAEPIAKPINSSPPTEWVVNSDGQSAWVIEMFVPCVEQFGDYL